MRVLIFGTFDQLHPGHEFVLRKAQARAHSTSSGQGELWVVVARDCNILRIKGKAPVQSEGVRVKAIEKLMPETHVILGDPEDFTAPLRAINPDLVLLGYDQALPPGVTEHDFPCPVERLPAFEPETYKSSLRRVIP